MSQPTKSGCWPLLVACYLVLALLPILLKLLEAPRFVAWSWWKTTAIVWGPWGMLVVLALVGGLLRLLNRPRARG